MKTLTVIATLLICCNIVFGSHGVSTPNYPIVNLQLTPVSQFFYHDFVIHLREKLVSEKTSNSIPILPTEVPVNSEKRFVLVPMTTALLLPMLTLAVDVTNAEIVGFVIGYFPQDRKSYFFNDVSGEIYESPLFNDSIKNKLPYGSSYGSLQADGAFRHPTKLGFEELFTAYGQLRSYPVDTSVNIASSLLVIKQMVSESARFIYVEEAVTKNYLTGFLPGLDIIVLQDSWTIISTEIQSSSNGLLSSPILLFDESGNPYLANTVEELKPKVSLLKGLNGASSLEKQHPLYSPYGRRGHIKKVVSV